MTIIELKYNPFIVKTELSIDGKNADLKCFGTGKDVRLRKYIGDFFQDAIKKCNLGPGSECKVQFYGTKDAFDDVKAAYDKYSSQSEDIKIELPDFIPYPHNFSEIKSLIEDKRGKYAEQLSAKEKEKTNPSASVKGIDIADVEKQFGKDKDTLEKIYNENKEKAISILAKAKEGLSLSRAVREEIDLITKNISDHELNKPENIIFDMLIRISRDNCKGGYDVTATTANEYYKTLIGIINKSFGKERKDITELLSSLVVKTETALNSHCTEVYNRYSSLYSGLKLNTLQNCRMDMAFDITIPDSDFSNLQVKTSSNVRIGIALIKENVDKALDNCQHFFDSLFDSLLLNLNTETEKYRDYYLTELLELQETVLKELTNTKHIEAEISAIENKIEGLDELKADIDKLEIG